MRILFVHPAVSMSIADVARGYRNALERQGHDIFDYRLMNRFAYHMRALPKEVTDNMAVLSRAASENVVVEALCNEVDRVVVVSGLNLHPIVLWLLGKVNIPVTVILTESPYEDVHQSQWLDISNTGVKVDLTVFTNDLSSATVHGWQYLPPAYDPAVHKPSPFLEEHECDVLMVGTGWPERQAFLEAVDWTGIDLRLYGPWMTITPSSPLHRFYRPQIISNDYIASMYNSAKICINFHRKSDHAMTPGPRCYEIAACGAFQLSDPRPGLLGLFGDSVPTFDSPAELEGLIRRFLANPERRTDAALKSRERVKAETFDNRAAVMMAAIQLQGV